MLQNIIEDPVVKGRLLKALGIIGKTPKREISFSWDERKVLGGSSRPATHPQAAGSVDRFSAHPERSLGALVGSRESKWQAFAGDAGKSARAETYSLLSPEPKSAEEEVFAASSLLQAPQFGVPQELPGFSRINLDGRIAWATEASLGVYYELVSAERENAIKRFLLQDIIAFHDSEDDYMEIGRPSKHDVWATLNYRNGVLIVAYEKGKLGNVDAHIDCPKIFSNGTWHDTNIFNDLLGGIFLKMERVQRKSYQRIYSLAANPTNKQKGIKGIGTQLVRIAAQALMAKDSPIDDDVEALRFNFYWMNHSTLACYFANNPDLLGVVDGVLYKDKKLSGNIPISPQAQREAAALHEKAKGAELISPESAMDEKYHDAPFAVQFPQTEFQPKNYSDEHRQMIMLYEHMFSKHKAVGIPRSLSGRQIGFGFVPR